MRKTTTTRSRSRRHSTSSREAALSAAISGGPSAVRRYVTAGRATLTLVSGATGVRFTYRVRRSRDGLAYFVRVLTGPETTDARSWSFLGTFFPDPRDGSAAPRYARGRNSRIAWDAPSAKAWTFFFRNVFELDRDAPAVTVCHDGRCGRCARPLTVPESVASGIGPDCAAQMGLPRAPAGPRQVRGPRAVREPSSAMTPAETASWDRYQHGDFSRAEELTAHVHGLEAGEARANGLFPPLPPDFRPSALYPTRRSRYEDQ